MQTSMPTACVQCNATKLTRKEEKWGYTLYECAACKLQFWWPFKNPGHESYEQSGRYRDRNFHPQTKSLYHSQILFLKKPVKPETALLDLGMGTGRFLSAAKEKGYRVTGTDFEKDAIVAAQTVFKLDDVYDLDLESFFKKFPERKFDIITMFEVLEHVDGYSFFPYIKDALKPGGYFAVTVPNRDCWKPLLAHEGPPIHLTRWSREAIEIFLNGYGFKVVSIKRLPIPLRLLISYFNDWTKGILSFSTLKRVEKLIQKEPVAISKPGPRRISPLMRVLRALSFVKLYILFTIPATILYVYIWATGGRNYTTLYVTAVPK
ncbi:hypothetical protein A2841_00345 [Candidatus Kaiserbacteria bacterium RIFCSPHIGHO2_01_FULL_48_10]|uniref:Methyltransferase type 11 domain-containing protein n=1 Tax=Candidatus Kaiserbacteria bacterium RIFCSPHIGHO2_01_FULL_48_10 TaxID=1798476 RepID=A0A1F6C1B1_9BACT|nr:MAG: hypothetical protein A2841_00345 [Candidatus Kaiserbacteria bacterium RIFCSPHIGHO2_01_FULL_48_10]